ncbi:Riboflavin synthase-like beta-barrel [Penicillium atrosanguineum]|uniref:Riboflavin synthase-like beta-barrel n=1 Tax=Penicillium atrosanguineum TaxID=1132637 RepID=A0A9W9PPL5_9EURO|nr:Riboflavin synthase-like beta-barrel [Penicillium atrosanguineum]
MSREDSIPHELRTAAEPRQNQLYPVRLSQVDQINLSIRLLRLALPSHDKKHPFAFQPGQWLDVHIPFIATAGGFTITSTPADAQLLPSLESLGPPFGAEATAPASQAHPPYVELAVQESPGNPPAAWLWKPQEEILGQEINIRVGGSFVWPPTGVDIHRIQNVVFIAGGVGINPLISILAHLHQTQSVRPLSVRFLYTSRLPPGQETASLDAVLDRVLFLPRLREIIRSQALSRRLRISLDLFLTNSAPSLAATGPPTDLAIHSRRISEGDTRAAVDGDGEFDPQGTVAYVCGPPQMTDEMVESLKGILGKAGDKRVFFEKWW